MATVALLFATGCGKTTPTSPPPAHGKAVLNLTVIAEPKEGAPASDAPGYVTAVLQKVDYTSLDNIVVWLEHVDPHPTTEPADAPVTLDIDAQKSAGDLNATACVGQQVSFHNLGSTAAHFYSVSDGNEFDLGTIPAGGTASATIASAGLIEVLSSTNPDPVIRLYAVPSHMVRITKSHQLLEFRDVTPGQYKVASWHPRLPGHTTTVDLSSDQTVNASIKVGVNGLPQPSFR